MGNLCCFAPINESSDCWSAAHSYNFNIRAKSMQQIKSNLIGWEETNDLALSLSCFYVQKPIKNQFKPLKPKGMVKFSSDSFPAYMVYPILTK